MIAYPPDLPAGARARIEGELADAEIGYAGTFAIADMRSSDRDGFAVGFLLHVFGAVIEVLCETARADAWSAEKLRARQEFVLDRFIEDTYRRKSSAHRSLREFATDVHRGLSGCDEWVLLLTTIRDLSAQTSIGQQLTALRKEAHWTVEELADQVKIDKTNVQDHLSGKTTPRPSVVKAYNEKFSAGLKRVVSLDVSAPASSSRLPKPRP